MKVTNCYFFCLFPDATTNGEAERLENRLRNLSSGLVGLRNCLHDQGEAMLPPTFVGSNYYDTIRHEGKL